MRLPADSEIPLPKLLQYLLVPLARADKSKFLAQAGYTAAHADKLLEDLRGLLTQEAEFTQTTEYGDKYRIRGTLIGPNGRQLRVVSIWMMEEATSQTKFVTLIPDKDEI